MKLPAYVSDILSKLKMNGYDAYAVGGCVRDSLLGLTPKDYDITTEAQPEDIKRVFSDYRTIDTGIRFGTVTIVSEGENVEVTTYRVDGEYNDNRRPENVTFTASLEEDLKRRDFAVNAIAYSPDRGYVDLFGGKNDLENKVIRAMGDPDERFNEDGLRILRALRFASTYGFSIERETADAIHRNRQLLKNISGERIQTELNKMICGNCGDILREFYDVFAVILPELEACVGFKQRTKYHDRDVYEHIIATVEAAEPRYQIRLAMLLHDIAKPDYFTLSEDGVGHFKKHPFGSAVIAERFLNELKYSRADFDLIVQLVRTHDIVIEERENLIKRYLSRYGVELFRDIVKVHIADDSGKAQDYKNRIPVYYRVLDMVDRFVDENECFSLKSLSVNGSDLTALGYKGKAVGEILDRLLRLVIDGECVNEKEALLDKVRKNR